LFWTFGKPFVGGWKIKGEVLEMERWGAQVWLFCLPHKSSLAC
jgi:hypothetical protein